MAGTMRDFAKACAVCGETGHREWQCDKDKLVTFQSKVQLPFVIIEVLQQSSYCSCALDPFVKTYQFE
jgi:hypothetical protein